jgi:hypothetical protein
MKTTRNFLACIVLFAGCASTQLPTRPPRSSVPNPLEGVWRGEFASSTPGHSGVLHINIKSGTSGDALMIVDEWTHRGSRYFDPPPPTTQQPELLVIAVARSGANDIQMATRAYRDLLCGCDVTVTFSGSLKWDAMEGTFRAAAADGHVMFDGTWNLRRLIESDARVDGNNTFASRQNRIEVELGDLGQLDS